jgi:hypothetical protein
MLPMLSSADTHITLNASQLAAAAKLFSSTVVQELAKKGKSPLFARLVSESGLSDIISNSVPISAFFDTVFKVLRRKAYRHEYAYKAVLTHKQLLGIHSLKTASMLTEFRVASCKADVVILNGTSTVYEVKSERDNLDRLCTQINAYQKVFARVNVITGETHLGSVIRLVPRDVGILLLNRQFKISTIREAVNVPERVDPATIFESLQRNEAFRILRMLDIDIPELPNTQLHVALKQLFERCCPIEIHACMVKVLKETRSLLPLATLLDGVPYSLKTAVISTPIRKQDHFRLLEAIRTPKEDALLWA